MRRFVSVLFFAFVAACGSDPNPVPPPVCASGSSSACTCADGRSGAQVCNAAGSGYGACACGGMVDAGTPPADMGCASENGAVACNRFMGTWCARIIMCCDASTIPCNDWTTDDASCRAYHVSLGVDCSDPTVTSTTNCTADVDRCIADVPLVACSDITGGTVNLPASCTAL